MITKDKVMTQEQIINLLRTAIELAGDGGPRPFTDEEEAAMYNFLGQIEASVIDFTDFEYDPPYYDPSYKD
jgi:hypothetical protein